MSLETGQTLLHYRLASKIGEGGMGVVWKAMDTSLGREVAIKVLPAALAGDASRLSRFEREARLLATLSHPNIAGVYGLHEADGVRFIAMELVGGEDLSHWLQRGLPSMDDALDVALQVARALEAAHGSGVIHRDLKPANVVRGDDGRVKVLDFGLAKAMEGEGTSGSSPSMSPTLTSAGTLAGMMMGTAAYMSPEQARGRPVDRRTDIWAFGCLLYELLTGARVFGGDNISDALAALLRSEPDWAALPAATPPAIRRLLRRLLAKDPDERLHDIADARLEIISAHDEPEAEGGEGASIAAQDAAVPVSRLGQALPWMVAALALAAAGWMAFSRTGPAPTPVAPRMVTSILPPAGMGFGLSTGLALSPDGTRLAFTALDDGGRGGVWIRPLDEAVGRAVPGTEGGGTPFWPPDGSKLGFKLDDTLRSVDLASGVTEVLAEGIEGTGASWGVNGIIYASGDLVQHIPASGGEPRTVSARDMPSESHMWPAFLPDGRHFLFHARRYGADVRTGQVRLGSLDSPESTLILNANTGAVFMPPGHLVWWEGGNLRAQPFDPDRLVLQGQPVALVSRVRFDARTASAAFSIAATGLLIYQQGDSVDGNELVWFDRQGNDLGRVGPSGSLYSPSLSADGRRIAVDISGETNQGDIWIIETDRGTANRLTAAQEDESCPVWSPDGSRIAYCSVEGVERDAVFAVGTGGRGGAEVLVRDEAETLAPSSWLGDDLLVDRGSRGGDVMHYSLADGTLRPYLTSSFDVKAGVFSPDGKHVAYGSDETGEYEIFVQTFPEPGRSIRISSGGGSMARWGPDGSELFFMAKDNTFMAVPVTRGTRGLEFGVPVALFTVDIKQHSSRQQWDVAGSDRFLFNRNIRAGAKDALTLVQGWQPGLQ